jgi:RNA polymerase sigma-70 factor, ECF subfamily
MKPLPIALAAAFDMEGQGDEIEDVERLVARYRTPVLRFVFASVRDMDLAETVTQDCLWKAHRTRHLFRGECSVHTWLLRIAVNLIRDHTRTRRWQFWRNVPRLSIDAIQNRRDGTLSPERAVLAKERLAAVWEATNRLSAQQRTVFLLRFVEELEIAEIAQVVGLTENAVHVNLFRAIRAIRKSLGTTS